MTSSKQRRLSAIFRSSTFPKEEVPEVPALPKSVDFPPTTPTADEPFRKLSQAQRHLKTFSIFFQSPNTKMSEDISQHPPILRKPAPAKGSRPRSTSGVLNSDGTLYKGQSPPNALQPQDTSPNGSPQARGRQSSLIPPLPFDGIGGARSVSSPAPTQRPATSYQIGGSSPLVQTSPKNSEGRLSKTRWGKSRKSTMDVQPDQPRAWVIAGKEKVAYNIELLKESEKVPELWNEEGDTYVYLFPRTANPGPSFKVSSMVFADSQPLLQLAHGQPNARYSGLSIEDAARKLALRGQAETPPYTPKVGPFDSQTLSDGSDESMRSLDLAPQEHHLYFPITLSTDGAIDEANAKLTDDDVETLIKARNLFAFLAGQPLVATPAHPRIFTIFLSIAQLLKQNEFTNDDGSTFGNAVSSSFSFYIDELRLADVRSSREKTIEGIILGERMRSTELYNEAFAHAVGKYESIKSMGSFLFSMISANSQKKLERASMELYQRQKSVGLRLNEFDFPSLWSGVAGSTSSIESKVIRFKLWKQAFLDMRKHIMSYYRSLFGSWPPKASSKKNNFVESGLNRLVLMTLYNDFSALYDLLVDRTSPTTRTIDSNGNGSTSADDPLLITKTLRRILAEFDSSSPPVQPPVPFDIPNIPSRTAIDERHIEKSIPDQVKANSKKLKEHESLLLLAKSHNIDSTLVSKRPFIEAFKVFEAKSAKHCSTVDVADQRYGHWLFMYVVLQSLPLLVIDAPGVRFNEGVEYFLCAPPRGGLPWMEQQEKKAWFGVAGGAGMVELPKDIVEYGVVATYQRSHCWIMAEQWGPAIANPADYPPVAGGGDVAGFDFGLGAEDTGMPNFDNEEYPPFSPLLPPPGFVSNRPGSSGSDRSRRSRSGSPGPRLSVLSNNSRPRSSFYGLEPLPFERAPGHARVSSRSDRMTPDLQPPPAIGGGGGEGRHSRNTSGSEKAAGGMSFDDILGGMTSDVEGKKKKDKKKK